MLTCDTLIRNANVLDGSGAAPEQLDVAILGDRIFKQGPGLQLKTSNSIDAEGFVLAPGFVDAHTHDDISVIAVTRTAVMVPA